MAHIIILLNEKADCVIALAVTAGDTDIVDAVEALKNKAGELHEKLEHNLVPPLQRGDAHQALVDAQQLLQDMCDNQNIINKVGDVQAKTTAIEAFL